jgi:predicted metal-dependent peptidase
MEHDLAALNRDLDRVKSAIFLGKNAAFFGSLMCSLNFKWSDEVSTAGTDAINIIWNPDFFAKLTAKARETVLKHELWHVARLHHLRQGSRDHQNWNRACDYRINNDLVTEGCSFDGLENCCKDSSFDALGIMCEEDIYDRLPTMPPPPPDAGSWTNNGETDMLPQTDVRVNQAVVNAVVRAVQQAKLAGQPGSIPGGIEETLKQFLEPQIPWKLVLMNWFTDRIDEDYSWKRPNRRYQDIYLPSRFTDDGRLAHLCYYLDVSGSISEEDVLIFNSEVKYIQEVLKPEKLTLIQFDTRITHIKEFKEDDPFDEITIIGRGGTSLVEVKEHIEKNLPTAAIIFSDLYVAPMERLSHDIPVIWVAVKNKAPKVPFGKLIHIH